MSNKDRGRILEKETEKFWQEHGFDCKRVFASGQYKDQLGEEFSGDVRLENYKIEAKRRKGGFKLLYDAFEQDKADILVIRQDRARRLYVLEESVLLELMKERKNEISGDS
tara:strand:+ start:83 stop:415 length:333 start_codon:yes stop_codon:yes gene_type:complete